MNFLRQFYEHSHNAYNISVDDILDSGAKSQIRRYMSDKFGVSLDTALDAIAGGSDDFTVAEQADIIKDAQDGVKAAIYYCFYRCYGKIIANYKMFLGKNPSIVAKRIAGEEGEGKDAYITYAYLALAGDFSDIRDAKAKANTTRVTDEILDSLPAYYGLSNNALELYKSDAIGSSMRPFIALGKVFEGCLQTIIRTYIPKENAKGINYRGSDVSKVDLTNGPNKTPIISMDKEIDDEHSGATSVGEKISSEVGGYKGVEQEVEDNGLLDDWIDFCTTEPDLYRVFKNTNTSVKTLSAFDDYTDKKRPIFPCDVLKAYLRAISKYKGEATQAHVNDELKSILGIEKLQPMQWKAAGHNANNTETPDNIMKDALQASGLTGTDLAKLIYNFGVDKLISYIDDQLYDE